MGLRAKLRDLDDRALTSRGMRTFSSWLLVGIAAVLVALVIVVVDDGDPEPLGFNCVVPEQGAVGRVLGTPVDGSRSVGGVGSRQAVATWMAEGQALVRVTCTSLTAEHLTGARIDEEDAGYVAGEPPIALVESETEGFAAEIWFAHESAQVVMELARDVDEQHARELVRSWQTQVELLGSD